MEPEEVRLYVMGLYVLVCAIVGVVAWVVRQTISKQAKFRSDAANAHRLVRVADLLAHTAVWFATSVSLSLFNKWFYSYWRGGFDLPVSATAAHMCVKAALAQWLVSSRLSPLKEEPYPLLWRDTILVVIPVALATAGDVALSNAAFLFITVTLYTIIKSASLLWIFFWGRIFGLEQCSVALLGVCGSISLGLGLASYGATRMSLWGVVLVLAAGCLGGLRWALSQRLMLMDEAFRVSPLLLVAKIAPWTAGSAVLAALVLDGRRLVEIFSGGWEGPDGSPSVDLGVEDAENSRWTNLAQALGFVLVGGVASFVLLLTEVKLLQLTSSLTLGVLGTVKEILQILLAILVFHDSLSAINLAGLALCISGTCLYHRAKSGAWTGDATDHGHHEYDSVVQADAELIAAFEESAADDEDGELSDGWDDTFESGR